MSETNPMAELRELHPIFEFKNKSGSIQTVQLADNQTVQVHVKGILKLRSDHFINLPSTAAFKFIKPSLDDLRLVGLLKNPTAPADTKSEDAGPAPSTSSSSSQAATETETE